ncbi:late competence development ComFB family protein [Thalassomonas actiniarum]|uniref:Late competence development ComFB family protein n=1 Tax=Thalassomonas actiniarum TaxID=485447 RepID=A0AAE9YP20_9GAMM|nr:late competence development ComFB family protein [Thalassomonas actiniarum]WDD97593.1 late competence development ComFB family protein [Thalassomonas actiniarum]
MNISNDIHNYYEKLVVQHFTAGKFDDKYDADFLADLTCIVLNQLPTRYIRHEVDMSFYLPASERFEMESNVKAAVAKALEFMKSQPVSK